MALYSLPTILAQDHVQLQRWVCNIFVFEIAMFLQYKERMKTIALPFEKATLINEIIIAITTHDFSNIKTMLYSSFSMSMSTSVTYVSWSLVTKTTHTFEEIKNLKIRNKQCIVLSIPLYMEWTYTWPICSCTCLLRYALGVSSMSLPYVPLSVKWSIT